MATTRAPLSAAAVLTVAAVLIGNTAGCGSQTITSLHKIGGSVTGLTGTLKLANNGGDTLTVTALGSFQFATGLKKGAAYSVTVAEPPVGQACAVTDGSGTVGDADVSSVSVTCGEGIYTVGGTVAGLQGTLQLANGNDTLTVTTSGDFHFATAQKPGGTYNVTVARDPVGQTCSVAGGQGTVGGVNVTSVAVTCKDVAFSVGGSVSGLDGTLKLNNNGGDTLTVTASGAFHFATPLKPGASYAVTVAQAPSGQTCSVSGDQNTIASADVTSVVVTCSNLSYTLGGSVSGLSGTVVLSNSSDTVTVNAGTNGFTFQQQVAHGSPYEVKVKTQPTGQRCDVTSGTGTIGGSNVATVAVACQTSYSVKVHVTNLIGDSLQLTGGTDDVVSIDYDGSNTTYDASFAWHYVAGDPYTVNVTKNPQTNGGYATLEVCTPVTSTGSVSSSDVTVNIHCTQAYVLNVEVERQSASTMVELSDGISPNIQSSSDSSNPAVSDTFQESYADGSHYSVQLVQGSGCVACPGTGQSASGTTLSGSFAGNDVTVTYACGVQCPQVN